MIKVAIIGAGIGREHLQGYLQLPKNFHVKFLCDLDEARAKEVAGSQDIIVETDLGKVLDDEQLDLVDICLPPHLHLDAVLKSLAAGKHVICEKPLAASISEVDQIVLAAKKADRQVFPVFQYRYGLAMTQLQALQTAGLVGKPFVASLETHWNRGKDYYSVPWRGTWQGERGGAVLGHAIHNHDLLTTIFGPVGKLAARTATRVNDIEVEDCAAISFEMANGALATSSITLGASADTTRLRFCFEHLTAESDTSPYAPMTGSWRFTSRDPNRQVEVDAITGSVSEAKAGFAGYFHAVALALQGRPGKEVTLEQGRQSIELVTAIYQSSNSGESVTFPLPKNTSYYESWIPEQRLGQQSNNEH